MVWEDSRRVSGHRLPEWFSEEELAERIVQSWMESRAGHRDTLLDRKWTVMGIGVKIEGEEVWTVQNVGRRC